MAVRYVEGTHACSGSRPHELHEIQISIWFKFISTHFYLTTTNNCTTDKSYCVEMSFLAISWNTHARNFFPKLYVYVVVYVCAHRCIRIQIERKHTALENTKNSKCLSDCKERYITELPILFGNATGKNLSNVIYLIKPKENINRQFACLTTENRSSKMCILCIQLHALVY